MFKKIWAGVVLGALWMPVVAAAAEVRFAEQASLPSSERISDDFYIAGGNVSSSGNVAGDLAAFGGNVLVTSAVMEDVFAGGGTVSILGSVSDDVRAVGGNITINSRVEGDVVVGGGQIQISGTGIGGDVLAGGGSIRIEAPVTGDIKIGGGEVYINAPVRGNVEFWGEKLTLGSAAVIQGTLSYTSPTEATMESGATVRGETTYTKQERNGRDASKAGVAGFMTLAALTKFLMALACAMVLGLFFRRYATTLVREVASRPLMALGRGFGVFVLTPAASIVLLITILGVPLGILGLIMFAAMIVFTSIVAPIIIGSIAHNWAMKPGEYQVNWLTILVGVLIYTILGWIPFIGWIAKFALFLMTLGVAMKIKWDIAKEWK